MKTTIPCPTEDEEQIALMQWAAVMSGRYPELRLMYHIPNGGARSKPEAARFKAMGVKKGVPDICLPVARGPFHGLYIELKRQRGGKASDEQKQWIEALRGQGYAATVCKGWRQAAGTIEIYLKGEFYSEPQGIHQEVHGRRIFQKRRRGDFQDHQEVGKL